MNINSYINLDEIKLRRNSRKYNKIFLDLNKTKVDKDKIEYLEKELDRIIYDKESNSILIDGLYKNEYNNIFDLLASEDFTIEVYNKIDIISFDAFDPITKIVCKDSINNLTLIDGIIYLTSIDSDLNEITYNTKINIDKKEIYCLGIKEKTQCNTEKEK